MYVYTCGKCIQKIDFVKVKLFKHNDIQKQKTKISWKTHKGIKLKKNVLGDLINAKRLALVFFEKPFNIQIV